MKARIVLVLSALIYSTSVGASEVAKDYWVEAMKTALPATFCKADQFFRQCFDVTVDECEKTVTLATRLCLHNYLNQIPDTLVQPKDGAKWANIIGQCVGESSKESLAKKFKDSHRCRDIDHWK